VVGNRAAELFANSSSRQPTTTFHEPRKSQERQRERDREREKKKCTEQKNLHNGKRTLTEDRRAARMAKHVKEAIFVFRPKNGICQLSHALFGANGLSNTEKGSM
jgi:hypothetical protein